MAETGADPIVKQFMLLDQDESSSVSFEEYMAMVQERATTRFSLMDTNADGEVTAEEYQQFWLQRKAEWYRIRR